MNPIFWEWHKKIKVCSKDGNQNRGHMIGEWNWNSLSGVQLFATPCSIQFSSVQSLSCVRLFVTLWTASRQASLSITNSRSLLKLMSIGLVMPSNQLILCRPLSCPQSFPASGSFPVSQFIASGGQSIGVSASTSVPPVNIQNCFPLGLVGYPYSPRDSQESSSTVEPQFKSINSSVLSFLYSLSHIHTWLQEKP